MNNYVTIKRLTLIKSIPIQEYDIIISDFEPISCWAAKLNNKVCIGLSNQAATLHPLAPKPKKSDPLGKAVLNHYAPVTHSYGFHFKSFDSSISTPIIRKEIRNAIPSNKGHITVYLPSYDDKRIIEKLKHFRDIEFQVFSKHIRKEYKKSHNWLTTGEIHELRTWLRKRFLPDAQQQNSRSMQGS